MVAPSRAVLSRAVVPLGATHFATWSGQCGGDAAACRDDAAAITCRSESAAAACGEQLRQASCAAAPSGCDLSDIADRAVAIAGCNDFVDALCAADTRCGSTVSAADCGADVMATIIDCSQAIGLDPSLDTCLEQLDTLACDASDLPAPCMGAIKVLQ